MISVTIDLSRVKAALGKFSPQQLSRRARGAMQESLAYLHHQVVTAMPVDTGAARQSVFTETRGTSLEGMRGTVASPLAYTVVLEKGRRPGQKMPPVMSIMLWVHRKKLVGSYSIKTHRRLGSRSRQAREDYQVAWLIARALGRRGLPAHKMFENAATKGKAAVQSIWLRWFKAA